MKLGLALIFSLPWLLQAATFDHSSLDEVLRSYVNDQGMVDYSGLKADRDQLDNYLISTGAVSRSTFDRWNENEQLAFLINVYNAETLQFIIDHYPTSSIKKLGGLLSSPWDRMNVALFGSTTTLDHVEHEIIRPRYNEPRIHFALVCAAVSCPPLRREAFTGNRLDAQLDDQARVFLSESEKNRIEGDTLFLSAIFKWYGGDFTTRGATLNDYVDPLIEGDASGKKIKFTHYDWDLNTQ